MNKYDAVPCNRFLKHDGQIKRDTENESMKLNMVGKFAVGSAVKLRWGLENKFIHIADQTNAPTFDGVHQIGKQITLAIGITMQLSSLSLSHQNMPLFRTDAMFSM